MIQGRRGTCFSQKSLQCLRIAVFVFRQELQRNSSSELGVLGFIDHAHASAAQLAENPVVSNEFAIHRGMEMLTAGRRSVNCVGYFSRRKVCNDSGFSGPRAILAERPYSQCPVHPEA